MRAGCAPPSPISTPRRSPWPLPVTEEKVVYLLDPIGASRRSWTLRAADACIRAFTGLLPFEHEAVELPWSPPFLHKTGGLVLSMGQFMQWVGAQVQSTGTVQIWPGTPVAEALIEDHKVVGVRLLDQGVDKQGKPGDGFMPGMDIHAALTVVGDGPVGPIGQQLDAQFGLPEGHHTRDWAVGMKFVVDLPADTALKPGTVLHTFGFPEPEIFGFFYVHPDRVASLGIFVPSWFDTPGAHGLPLPPALDAASLSLALPQGRQAAFLGREDPRRIGPPRRAAPGRRRLRARRRRLRHHQRPHRLRRGRSLDHRRSTGRKRPRTAQGQEALHPAEPRRHLPQAPPRKLGGSRRRASPRSRATASRRASCAA